MKYFRLWRIILSILVLAYTLLPFDVLPDMVVGWGWLDDIAIIYLLWHYFYRGGRGRFGTSDRESADSGQSGGEGIAGKEGSAVPKTPYDILDVPRGASPEEIRLAYKKLAGKYHPDKVAHLGKEFQELAEERFKEIQAAYEKLKTGFD